MLHKKDLVLIEWMDSRVPSSHWEFSDEVKPLVPVRALTVGFLIDDKAEYKTVVPTRSISDEEEQIIGRMTIPSCSILKMRKLK